MTQTGLPTTIGLIKTGLALRHEPYMFYDLPQLEPSTHISTRFSKMADKIRLMVAKLRQLSSSSSAPDPSLPNTPQITGRFPHRPSLPAKPPPPTPSSSGTRHQTVSESFILASHDYTELSPTCKLRPITEYQQRHSSTASETPRQQWL
jgi:hypothetical protein